MNYLTKQTEMSIIFAQRENPGSKEIKSFSERLSESIIIYKPLSYSDVGHFKLVTIFKMLVTVCSLQNHYRSESFTVPSETFKIVPTCSIILSLNEVETRH